MSIVNEMNAQNKNLDIKQIITSVLLHVCLYRSLKDNNNGRRCALKLISSSI